MMRRAATTAAAGLLALAAGTLAPCTLAPCAMATGALAGERMAAITASPITAFRIGSGETRFGALEFVGGLAMTSAERDFGALSSLRFLDATGTRFAAVADNGFFLTGAVIRDGEGRPAGMAPIGFTTLPGLDGRVSNAKWETDAESLLVQDGSAIIGYERRHRLTRYAFDGETLGAPQGSIDFVIPAKELRSNRGFETLAEAPAGAPLAGAIVAVSEKSIDAAGNIYAAVLSGPRKGVFTIARSDEFDITDGDFLPGGDLVILERSYQMAKGVRMRLRRIGGDAIRPGAVVDGEILLEADMRHQIDNMEGLDIWQAADGTTRFGLVSDDNKSILQRNLYLEFTLAE